MSRSASTAPSDPWRHVLRPEDLSLSLALLQTDSESQTGLPYSDEAVWPLDKDQIALLGFELDP